MNLRRRIPCLSAKVMLMSIFLTVNMILFVHSQIIDWNKPDPFEVVPSDSLLFVGETLKLCCEINKNETKINSSDLYMKFVNKFEAQWNRTVLNTSEENKACIELIITDTYAPHTSIYCINKKTNVNVASFLYVERPLKEVVNITGVYLYDVELNLTWCLGETYFQSITVETTWLNYAYPNGNYSIGCRGTNESCIIKKSNITLHDTIFFNITVCTNSLKKRPSLDYLQPLFQQCSETAPSFNLTEITKAGPPFNLTITDRSSTCLSLTWMNSSYLDACTYCPHIYHIFIREDAEEKSQFREILNNTDQAYPLKYMAVKVCNLKPLTTYALRLQIKGYEFQPWSDAQEIRASTKEDRPLTGPLILRTAYHEEGCVNNKKQVTVFWNDMDSNTLQGILTNYQVFVSNQNITLRPGTNNFKTEMNCSDDTAIQFYAATKVGLSQSSSEIYIPSDAETLASPPDINLTVEEYVGGYNNNGMKDITVRWKANSVEVGHLKLSFYLCHEYYQPKLCLNDYKVLEVNFSEEIFNLTQIDVKTNLFGFALEQDNVGKRGIAWTDCVFQADSKPGQPKGLYVREERRGGPLAINWISEPCDKNNKALVLQYIIQVCEHPVDKTSSCTEIKVSSSTEKTEVKNLKRNQAYEVRIMAATAKQEGQYSDPQIVTTSEQDEDPVNKIVGILLGCFSAAVILGICLSCLIRKCRISRERFKSLKLKILEQNVLKSLGSVEYINAEAVYVVNNPEAVSTPGQQHEELSNISQKNNNNYSSNHELVTTFKKELKRSPIVLGDEPQHMEGSNSTGLCNTSYVHMTMVERDEYYPPQKNGSTTKIATESSFDQTCSKQPFLNDSPVKVVVCNAEEYPIPKKTMLTSAAGHQLVTEYVTIAHAGVVAKVGAVSKVSGEMTLNQNLEHRSVYESDEGMDNKSQVEADKNAYVLNTLNLNVSMSPNEIPENHSSDYVQSVQEILSKEPRPDNTSQEYKEEPRPDNTSQGYKEEPRPENTSQEHNLTKESKSESISQGYNVSEELRSDSTSHGYKVEPRSQSTSQGYISYMSSPSTNASQAR